MQFGGGVRRIYTDGRDWPAKLAPSYIGTCAISGKRKSYVQSSS
jgi:hypothetical protein